MPRTSSYSRVRVVAGAFALMVSLVTCATNPVTGKKELSFVSESQEIQMGREYATQVSQEMGVYDNDAVQQYVSRIGKELAAGSERPRLPWTFTVMDDPQVNAFALPGGFIFVTRGILTHMNSEAELATVIGHEIGHVTARHSVQQMTRTQLAQIGLVAGAIASERIAQNMGAISSGLGVLFLKYGRDDETQADGLGFRYALNDNYDVRHMVDMFKILQRVSGDAGDRIPEWQSSHPDPGNRIEATEARLKRVTVPLDGKKVGRAEFMRIIDGMVFGDNPRQGYFKDGTFYHPDMAFSLQFPSGWKTANQPSAVVGVSQAGDAQVQLSLAGKEAPSTTLQKFLGQQGVTAGQTSSASINGNTAAQGTFTAQNQDGSQLAGRVAFVSYNGTTFQLLALGTAQGARNNAGAFSEFIGSFRRLTDQAALNVQPNRIAIVTVPRAMSLRQFNVQYPSTIALDKLALINGLDDEDAQLKQGDVVKRVVAK